MLVLTRKKNQNVHIGEGIIIHVFQVKGKVVRLGIEAPNNVKITRGEIRFGDCHASLKPSN